MAFNQTDFNNFINRLTSYTGSSTVFNQYLNPTQISNLEQYLINIEALNPTILLVGEAPGYKGCAITGIPFTSEFIINTHNQNGVLANCTALGNQREGSATILWEKLDERQALGKLNVPPLIWNIFPFHPHDNGNLLSNRTPIVSELILGLSFLNDLINLFPSITNVFAIGQSANQTINMLPQFSGDIRHPSNGGKPQFNADIDALFP